MDWLSTALSLSVLLFYVALLVYWVAVVIVVVLEDRDPATTLAWILLLWFLPFIGLVIYFLFGRNWKRIAARQTWVAEMTELGERATAPYQDRAAAAAERAAEHYADTGAPEVMRFLSTTWGARPVLADSVRLLPCGADYFDAIERDIRAATRFVHLQFFIWGEDELTTRITDLLVEKLEQGVEVRATYDWWGSLNLGKKDVKRLMRAGADVRADLAKLRYVNYRNHRKIVVIDGEIGYTGGMNLKQEYIDGGTSYPSWRDTGIRLTGDAVAELQMLFAERWYDLTRDGRIFEPDMFPGLEREPAADAMLVQVAAQSIADPWESARRAHAIAISTAREAVWLQTPYFVPDLSFLETLINAAKSGRDVRTVMVGRTWCDKRIAWYPAWTYFPQYLQAGARLFFYEAGFYHPKVISVDHRFCAVGTMNIDVRALRLNQEFMVWIYDERFTALVDETFGADFGLADEVTLDDVEDLSLFWRVRASVIRLVSNLL